MSEKFTLSRSTKLSSNTNTYSSERSRISGYQDLPQKVLLKIFKNFKEEELIQSVIPVCQNWNYTAFDPSLWKTLTVKNCNIPANQICQRLRLFKQLEKIFFKKIAEPVLVLRQLVMCSKNLKCIKLRYCNGLREYNLRHLIRVCENLEELDLKGTEFKGSKFYQDLPNLKKLKSINLSENKYLTKQNIFTVVLNCRGLEQFLLSVTKNKAVLTESEWHFIINYLSANLKGIAVDASALGNNTFISILRCPFVEKISFCGAYNLDGDVFQMLSQHSSKLTTLKLRFAHLVDGYRISNVFLAKDMTWLEVLDLTGCWKITDDTIEAMARCTGLKRLNLKNCKRISSLEPVVSNCPLIEQLNVAFCASLRINSSLLSFSKLSLLFVDRDEKFRGLLEEIGDKSLNIKVMVCISEYNKKVETLNCL